MQLTNCWIERERAPEMLLKATWRVEERLGVRNLGGPYIQGLFYVEKSDVILEKAYES